MEDKTTKMICQIRNYKSHGSNQITIPKDVMAKLGLQKGDYVEVSITLALRPTVEDH